MRSDVFVEPLIHGHGHESGRRAGTESAMLTAALGEACVFAADLFHVEPMKALRDRLPTELKIRFGDMIALNGHPEHRLANTLNVSFVRRASIDVLAKLERVAASTGSACHAGRIELSPVPEAMGIAPKVGMGAVRFSLGRGTTEDEIHAVA